MVKYTTDPQMAKLVERKKIKIQQDEEKRKIIEEEMANTKKLLSKRQVDTK